MLLPGQHTLKIYNEHGDEVASYRVSNVRVAENRVLDRIFDMKTGEVVQVDVNSHTLKLEAQVPIAKHVLFSVEEEEPT